MDTRYNRLIEAVLTCTTIYVLSKIKKKINIFHLKIIFFTAVKNCTILHGRVFVMALLIIVSEQASRIPLNKYFMPILLPDTSTDSSVFQN